MDQEQYCRCSRPDLRDVSGFLCLSCGLETNFLITQTSCERKAEDEIEQEELSRSISSSSSEEEILLDPDGTPFPASQLPVFLISQKVTSAPCETHSYYEKLEHASEFRLLRLFPRIPKSDIVCEVFHADILDPPEYEAVSYTWGRTLTPNHKLHTTKGPIMVTANCISALRALRHDTRDRILWVDAICIAQNDALEKNHQIPLMPRIYAEATCVMIHLGDNSELDHMSHLFNHLGNRPSKIKRFVSKQNYLASVTAVVFENLGFAGSRHGPSCCGYYRLWSFGLAVPINCEHTCSRPTAS